LRVPSVAMLTSTTRSTRGRPTSSSSASISSPSSPSPSSTSSRAWSCRRMALVFTRQALATGTTLPMEAAPLDGRTKLCTALSVCLVSPSSEWIQSENNRTLHWKWTLFVTLKLLNCSNFCTFARKYYNNLFQCELMIIIWF